AEPDRRDAARGRREPRPDAELRARRVDGRRGGRGVRRHLSVQSRQPLRPDLATAVDRRPRRPRQRRRRRRRSPRDGRDRGARRSRDLPDLGVVLVLHRPDRVPARPSAGDLRPAGADAVSRAAAAGVLRGGTFAAAGIAFPFVVHAAWIVNIGVLTLMYAALATAWNLFSGYSGYISLGQAAFFGLGAYTLGITFNHLSIGSGYRPFYVLPVIGLAVALVSVPVAWIALRTRAMTFAIVTLMLLFIVQQLAFNLRSLTHGSQGVAVPQPTFASNFDRPYYLAMLALLAVSMLVCWFVRNSNLGLMLFAVREDE